MLCGAAARPRPRAAPTCRRARNERRRGPAPPRRRPRRGRGRGRNFLLRPFAPRARPPRARAGPGPVLCDLCSIAVAEPSTPSTRHVSRPFGTIRHRTRRGKRTLNAGPFVAFSGQSTQISTGSRNAGRISRSTHGSAGGWSAGAASPRNADSRSSAIVLATVRRRAASIFVWTIASIFRVVVRAAMLASLRAPLRRVDERRLPQTGARRTKHGASTLTCRPPRRGRDEEPLRGFQRPQSLDPRMRVPAARLLLWCWLFRQSS